MEIDNGEHEALLSPMSETPAPTVVFEHPVPLWRRRYCVVIFSLTASLLFADQNLLAPNLSMAAESFRFDNNQRDSLLGGVIMAAFFIVGAPSALVVGWLTDKVNRRNLLFFIVVLGEAPCLCTYWVTEYWQFIVLRTLTGISVGGCFPLIYSLLGDLFPISQRNIVSASVAISTGAGVAVGQALAGWIGPASGDWRLPFMVVAAPALLLAVVMLLTCVEPPRGAFEEALREHYAEGQSYNETITWPKVKALLQIPSNVLIIVQGLFGSLPWGMILTFLNDYLAAGPPSGQGLGVHTATGVLIAFGLGGGIGVIAGGIAGQKLYNKRKEYLPILMFCAICSGLPFMAVLVNAHLASIPLPVVFLVALCSGCCSGISGPNLRAIILNVNEPETRGVALALQSMTDDVGKGLGPVFVAIFISALGRRQAFNLAVAGWIPSALMLGSLVWHIRRDEDCMQCRLQDLALSSSAAACEPLKGCISPGGVVSPARGAGGGGGGGGLAANNEERDRAVSTPGGYGDGAGGDPQWTLAAGGGGSDADDGNCGDHRQGAFHTRQAQGPGAGQGARGAARLPPPARSSAGQLLASSSSSGSEEGAGLALGTASATRGAHAAGGEGEHARLLPISTRAMHPPFAASAQHRGGGGGGSGGGAGMGGWLAGRATAGELLLHGERIGQQQTESAAAVGEEMDERTGSRSRGSSRVWEDVPPPPPPPAHAATPAPVAPHTQLLD